MPSGPDLFDDQDGVGANHESSTSSPGTQRGPNYLFRRAIVVGGVVAVVATASIVIGQLMSSDSNDTTSGAISTDWNRIVLVDDRTGRVIVDSENGEELARIESGVRTPSASAVVDSTLVVAGTTRVAVIDIDSEDVVKFELGTEDIVRPAGSALTLLASGSDRGRAVLVHGPSGDAIDTDTIAPVVGARYEFANAQASASGRDVLVTDSGNFQSVLFSFDRDEPSFFPGLALAVDADIVVTAQNVGSAATVNVFDHDGEPITTGRTSSVRAGMITDTGVVLVTVDGAVVTMSPSSGDTSDVSQLDIGTIRSGTVTTAGDRLIVSGATGTAIVGGDGTSIASFEAQRPAGDGSPGGSTCVATISDDQTPETQIAVVDMTDGSVLVEAAGDEPLLSDVSGCIVGTTTPLGYDLMNPAGVQQVQTDDTALALSLDGAAIAVERDGRLVLDGTGLGDAPPDDPVDLGPRGRTVHFTQS